jgi:hypothetical protein
MAKINSISRKLVSGVGFSKGWALLALKEAAAVDAEQFNDLLGGHRPQG